MTTLADEIAGAAVRAARLGMFWPGASEAAFEWAMTDQRRWERVREYARGHLDATMPLQAPRNPPQQEPA